MANKQTVQPLKVSGLKPGATLTGSADVMLTKAELAAKLKVALRTIENWQHEGHLPFIKIANVVLFHWPTVLAHLQTHFSVRAARAIGNECK